jgi:uncharacterized protein (DUF1800 family)
MTNTICPPSENKSATAHPLQPVAEKDCVGRNTLFNTDSAAPGALSLIATALLAACGGGGGGGGSNGGGNSSGGSAPGFNNFPQAATDNEAARFLLQAQFAASPADISAVRATSFAGYIQQEFAKPISKAWDWLEGQPYSNPGFVYTYEIGEFAVWRDLISAPDVLRKRVAFALSQYFVISSTNMAIDWRGYALAGYWDLLNEHAFGNFRNLLEAVTLNPAMGHFLDTRGNQKEDAATGRMPDENYAREVMQLFTIGLLELNLDGSPKRDANGNTIETYGIDDVSQLARVFTGYDFDSTYSPTSPFGVMFPDRPWRLWGREYARSPMRLNNSLHSTLAVSFLNANISAGTDGAAALKTALDTLFNHPNVGPFFGRQMIQRLVTSNPSPAYVARVASAFNNNGAGVRGDLKAVWAAILLDDEARSPATLADNSFGKLREPVLRFVQWARLFNATSQFNTWKVYNLDLSQNPLRAPSVFNFFRPGFVPPGLEVTAPEFQLVSEITVGGYLNFMQFALYEGLGIRAIRELFRGNNGNVERDLVANYDRLLALITNTTHTPATNTEPVARAMLTMLNTQMCAGQLKPATLALMINALRDDMVVRRVTTSSNAQLKRQTVCAAILMVLACPEYLIQK